MRERFGDEVTSLRADRDTLVVDHFEDPGAVRGYYRAHFGPVLAAYEAARGDPARRAARDRGLEELAVRTNRAKPGGRAVYDYDYLRVVARRR